MPAVDIRVTAKVPIQPLETIDEIDDADFGGILVRGAVLGVPLTYLIALLVSLGAGLQNASMLAVWPAIMGGPWVGGVVMLMKHLRAGEARARNAARRSATAAAAMPTPRADLGHAA